MNELRRLATEAYRANDGDLDAAVTQVLAAISLDAGLYRAVTTPLLEYAVRTEIEALMRASRGEIWRQASSPRADTSRGLLQRAEKNLMDYPLAQGKRLAEAMKSEVAEAGRALIGTGQTAIMRGHWLLLVADNLATPVSVVGKELREADLARLKKKAEKDCGGLNPVGTRVPNAAAPVLPARSMATPSEPLPATAV